MGNTSDIGCKIQITCILYVEGKRTSGSLRTLKVYELGRVLPEIMTITHDHIVNIHRNSSPPYIHTHHEHIYKRHLMNGGEPLASNLIQESTGIQFPISLDITRSTRGFLNYR